MTYKLSTLAVLIGVAFTASAAHAQCGVMTPRTAIAWDQLPDNSPELRAVTRLQPAETRRGGEPGLTGMWKVTFSSGGAVVDQAFEVFHSDGTELMVDTAPPATGNVCTGVWARIDGVNFKLNHPSWTFDDKGNVTGTAIIKVNILLDSNSNRTTRARRSST
jgi:hypothetical protein